MLSRTVSLPTDVSPLSFTSRLAGLKTSRKFHDTSNSVSPPSAKCCGTSSTDSTDLPLKLTTPSCSWHLLTSNFEMRNLDGTMKLLVASSKSTSGTNCDKIWLKVHVPLPVYFLKHLSSTRLNEQSEFCILTLPGLLSAIPFNVGNSEK